MPYTPEQLDIAVEFAQTVKNHGHIPAMLRQAARDARLRIAVERLRDEMKAHPDWHMSAATLTALLDETTGET